MKWTMPVKVKIYEALGCIGDKRMKVTENEAKAFSSSKNKFYSVKYDPAKNAIMSNDNASYWGWYLGYPAISFLMLKGILKYNSLLAEALKDIKWKDINTKFKRDYAKTEEYVLSILKEKGFSIEQTRAEVDMIYGQLKQLNIEKLNEKMAPPSKEY